MEEEKKQVIPDESHMFYGSDQTKTLPYSWDTLPKKWIEPRKGTDYVVVRYLLKNRRLIGRYYHEHDVDWTVKKATKLGREKAFKDFIADPEVAAKYAVTNSAGKSKVAPMQYVLTSSIDTPSDTPSVTPFDTPSDSPSDAI